MPESLFLIKLQEAPATLLKKRLWHTGIFLWFCEIFKNTFFYRTPSVTASKLWDNVTEYFHVFLEHLLKVFFFLHFLEWIQAESLWCVFHVFFNIQIKTSEIYLHHFYSTGSSWLPEVTEFLVSGTGRAEGLGGGVISSVIPLEFGPLVTAPGKGAFFSS